MIVFNFSVLARPAETLALRQPDSEGRAVWGAFFDKYMGRLIVVCDEMYDRTQFMEWLKREQYKASMLDFLDTKDPVLKAEKVHRIGSAAGRIDWYIDNDARAGAQTLKLGIPTIVAAAPYVVRPEWDGGRVIKEWDSLVDELDTQALKAAERTWREV